MNAPAPTSTSTEQDISRRLEFVGLDERSCEQLRSLKPLLERELPVGLDKFYDIVRNTPEIRKFFRDENHISYAKNAQLDHWGSIVTGKFDEEYVRRVRAIGARHADVGLTPQWYIGGYSHLIEHFVHAAVHENWPSGGIFGRKSTTPDDFASLLVSLLKAILLDMDISLSVYFDKSEEAREKAGEEAMEAQAKVVESFGMAIRHIAAKDLSYRIHEEMPGAYDALKNDFNKALESLSETIVSIGDSAEQIFNGSEEIKSAADNMSKRAEQQAAAVEETAAAVEEITATVKSSTERAEESGKLVQRTKTNAEQSGDVVRKAVEAMDRINKSSDEIAKIISVIDDIAFQTNLLALNAGVEAARAGDAGKGFAVVAQEVRELAQRSAGAAKEIKDLITSSGEEVKNGVSLVNETGTALESIVREVSEINENVQAIIEAAREQSGGLAEINTSVSSIDQGTQQNAAMAEELTASSHSLGNEVATINAMLREFAAAQDARGPKAVSPAANANPKPSPARDLKQKVAKAFTQGNAAVAADDWEEF